MRNNIFKIHFFDELSSIQTNLWRLRKLTIKGDLKVTYHRKKRFFLSNFVNNNFLL